MASAWQTFSERNDPLSISISPTISGLTDSMNETIHSRLQVVRLRYPAIGQGQMKPGTDPGPVAYVVEKKTHAYLPCRGDRKFLFFRWSRPA